MELTWRNQPEMVVSNMCKERIYVDVDILSASLV